MLLSLYCWLSFYQFLSILITRIATIALTHTGLTRESAKFQARSAFSGAGFTTNESEMVVSHPVRRKIVMILILIGNAGIVAAISSLILYGRIEAIENLDRRQRGATGDIDHHYAVFEQKKRFRNRKI